MQSNSITYTSASKYFSLGIKRQKEETVLTMQLFTKHISTKYFPKTVAILQKELPSIFASQCYNESNFPFSKEVKHTEMGHLFEHMILEFLCIEKIQRGFREAIFSGITKWDWNRDPFGTFHIHLTIPKSDYVFFAQACSQSMHLLERILISHTTSFPMIPGTPMVEKIATLPQNR